VEIIKIDDLIRANLVSVIARRMDMDIVWMENVKAARQRVKSKSSTFEEEEQFLADDAPEAIDHRRWSKKQMSNWIGMTDQKLRGILDEPVQSEKRKIGKEELKLSEVIHLAAMLRVNPTLLLRPTKEQLIKNSMIEFENLGVNGLRVSALDWYRWISGIGALPGFKLDIEALSSFGSFNVNANANFGKDPLDAMDRINSDIKGTLSTFVSQHEAPLHGMGDRFKGEDAPVVHAATSMEELELRQARAITLLISDLRIALEYMDSATDSATIQKQISWTYTRIGRRMLEYGLKDQSLLDGIRPATAEEE
jgi:hypothetical protein